VKSSVVLSHAVFVLDARDPCKNSRPAGSFVELGARGKAPSSEAMGKRTVSEADAKGARFERDSKRQRVENGHERNSPRPNGTVEDVTHSRDLQKALLFDQSATPDFRNGKYSRIPVRVRETDFSRTEYLQAFPRFHPVLRRRTRPAPQTRNSP
jgi:hypothetical protein